MLDKLKKGKQIDIGEMKVIITSNLMKFKNLDAIYGDIISQTGNQVCCVKKINDTTALILRDKEKLLQMGLSSEERKAIYCHELGHCFSQSQQNNNKTERIVDDEVDSDTFAVKKCDIDPEILESALKKSYEYEIANINNKYNLTQERVDIYITEMSTRKRNIEELILENEKER